MSTVGERLTQWPSCDTGMDVLVKSFSDITPLEATHHFPYVYFYECWILWHCRILVLRGKGE